MKEYSILSHVKRIIFTVFILGLSFQDTFAQYQMENLTRGIVAVSTGGSNVFVSWRWLGTENDITFNLYRNGTKINASPLSVCNYTDNAGSTTASYYVKPVINGVEQAASESTKPWSQKYLQIPLNIPAGGKTPTGESYTYNANDCSIGDVDGDGTHEIFLKWDPSNSKDNSQSGYTGNVYIDCYTMKGVLLWRIDLGRNIRAGAHYTQFLVYDFDGDGKAEMACKTADATKDGKGVVIGNGSADYRNSKGYILTGPEYLTIFNGQTGAAMSTVNYTPARGTVSSWGDSYGNRVDRFIAAVVYLDGVHPSMVFGRGYYTRLVRSAWDFKNGKLVQRWIFDSNNSGSTAYKGQGNHQMTVGDVDGDGKQEFCNGASVINDNGTGLYTTGHGHGDALHMSDMDPDRAGLEVWQCNEEPSSYGNYALELKDAKTGQVIFSPFSGNQGDVGRCMAADIDPRYKGYEMWAQMSTYATFTCKGQKIATGRPSVNFAVYWDGDLQRELLDGSSIDKWDYLNSRSTRMLTMSDAAWGSGVSCNTTKATPNLSADLFGDWREEVILHSSDNKYLLIYTTTIPSTYKFRTLLHDPQYRTAIAWQNSCYNQPPHLGYYLGSDMATPAKPNITIIPGIATCLSNITSPSTSFCPGGSVVLTANTGASYKWLNGTTQVGTAATYTATTAGTYTLEVTNAAGCKATSSIAITAGAFPTATITVPSGTTIPYGGTTLLNASTGSGYSYQWKKGTVAISGATAASYSVSAPGSYTVTVTSNCSVTSSPIILIAAAPKKYIYNYDNSGNLSWSNTNSWTPKAIPTTIDTVIVRTGEVQIANLNHTAPVYVETNGILRLIDTSVVSNLHLQGGTLKTYTSSPGMVLTSAITVEKPSTIMAGSLSTTIFTLNGTITGNGSITKTSVGNLRINSTSTGFKGNWIITEGKIQLRSATGLGDCGVQVKAAARLDIEVAGASIYSLVVDTTGGVDLDQNLTTTVTVLGSTNILTGSFKNTNYPAYIGSTAALQVTKSLVSLSGPAAFCPGKNVTLTAASETSYSWKNSATQVATTVAYTSAVSGSYTVDVANALGCKVTSAPVKTTLSTLPSATITAGGATTFCTGGSVVLAASAGASYKWFNGTTQVGTAATYTATAAGSYTVEITNSAGCKATSAPTVITTGSAVQTPTITSTATSFCTGGSIVLTSSTGTSYKWFNGTTQVGTAATYTATAVGSYTVEVTNSTDCKATSVPTVITAGSVQLTPTITSPSTSFCPGSSVVLTSSAGTSYKWFNGTTQVETAATYTATTAGSYTVEVTNSTGCKATSAPTVITAGSMQLTPTISSPATSFCTGESIILTSSTGTSYKWFNGTTQVGTAATYTATTAGSYTVEVTNTTECKATSAPTVITAGSIQSPPTITSPSTSFCPGESVVLASSTGASYKWFNGTTQVGTTATYTATDAGSYTVEITNSAGCKATSAPTTLSISTAKASIDASTNAFCAGGSALLTASAGSSYKWFNGSTQVGTNRSYTVTTAGMYTVQVSNSSGCKTTAAIQISVSAPAATITSAANSFCPGSSVVLTANSGTAYKWFNGTTLVGTGINYTASTVGTYTVEVTNTDGCKATSLAKDITVSQTLKWYADTDGDGLGDPANFVTTCWKPNGYVSSADDTCPNDIQNNCADCAGVANGTAVLDNCNICTGGTTGKIACTPTATINGTTANIKVIPQPFDVNTTITLENYGNIKSITIISASGAIIESINNVNTTEHTIGDALAAGLYSVIIQTENRVYTTKIVKK